MTASGATVSCALCPLCGHLAQKIQMPVRGLQLPQQQHLCPPHKWQFRASQSPLPRGLQSAPHTSLHPVSLSLLSCPTPNTLISSTLWPRSLGSEEAVSTSLPFACMDEMGSCPETPEDGHLAHGHCSCNATQLGGHQWTSLFLATPSFLLPQPL